LKSDIYIQHPVPDQARWNWPTETVVVEEAMEEQKYPIKNYNHDSTQL